MCMVPNDFVWRAGDWLAYRSPQEEEELWTVVEVSNYHSIGVRRCDKDVAYWFSDNDSRLSYLPKEGDRVKLTHLNHEPDGYQSYLGEEGLVHSTPLRMRYGCSCDCSFRSTWWGITPYHYNLTLVARADEVAETAPTEELKVVGAGDRVETADGVHKMKVAWVPYIEGEEVAKQQTLQQQRQETPSVLLDAKIFPYVPKETYSADIVLADGTLVSVPDPDPAEWELLDRSPFRNASETLHPCLVTAYYSDSDKVGRLDLFKLVCRDVKHESGLCWLKDMAAFVNKVLRVSAFEQRRSYVTEMRHWRERPVASREQYSGCESILACLW